MGKFLIELQTKLDEAKLKSSINSYISSLGKYLKNQFTAAGKAFTGWLSAGSLANALISQIKQIPAEVMEVNSAMMELRKNSSASAGSLKKYFDEAADSAKALGVSVSDIIRTTAGWSRLGYSLPDAEKLAEAAALFRNIGDGIDTDTANTALAGALQGFRMTADEAVHIVDAFHAVSSSYAVSGAGIGGALQRSASSMYAAGNTLEETLGLIAAANETVQNPDSIGNAYMTFSMRIRGAKAEMEALGLETDGMAESTASLREEIRALSGVDIMKDKDSLKSTYQILDELAGKWESLNDQQRAGITGLIAGSPQDTILSALMNNFDIARDAAEAAVNSTGSALQAQEEYEKGILYSLDRLKVSYQEFANHLLDSDLLKGIIDFGNGAVNIIDAITDKLGSIGTIGAGAGLFAGIKNIGKTYQHTVSKYCCFECALHA